MTNVFVGPYFSNSLAGIVFRRFVAGTKAMGIVAPILTFPSITAPRYKATPQEEVDFIQLSASKDVHEAVSGATNAGIFFMDNVPPDEFLAQFSSQGIVPAVIILCSPVKTRALEQVAQRLASYNVELVTIQEPGRKNSAAALWSARMPLQPALSSHNPDLDTLLFDGALQLLQEVIDKSTNGKTIHLYDPFDFASLQPPIMDAIKLKLKEKDLTLKSFSFHTEDELLELANGKGIAINGEEMALLLGAVAEDKDNWIRRSEVIMSDIRAILHVKFPSPVETPTFKDVPNIPEGLKNHAEA
jgi:hypothetical protein